MNGLAMFYHTRTTLAVKDMLLICHIYKQISTYNCILQNSHE